MAQPVGIDLGTTKSVIAVLQGGLPTVAGSAEGTQSTPSLVAFTNDSKLLIGQAAVAESEKGTARVAHSFIPRLGAQGMITFDGRDFLPQQLAAFVLCKLKRDAEAYLGKEVTDAVVAVPADFGQAQRQAVEEAGQIAGLKVMRVIDAPTAAAMAYHAREHRQEATILVVDLGGGTLSVGAVEIGEGVIDTQATGGDNQLGGDDWDGKIADWLAMKFKDSHDIDLREDRLALQRIRNAAERARIELSTATQTEISLPYLWGGKTGLFHLDEKLTRAELQTVTADLLDRCKNTISQVINDTSFGRSSGQHHVLLIGGAMRMPAVLEMVRRITNGKELRTSEYTEIVAIGAAMEAGVLKGEVKDALTLRVVPRSLGVENKSGFFTKIIERNTTMPTKRSEVFSVGRPEDSSEVPLPSRGDPPYSVEIGVYEGEQLTASLNTKLGTYSLSIPSVPGDVPTIEVTMDVDAFGVLRVSAANLGATEAQSSQWQSWGSKLSEDDIERMRRQTERLTSADQVHARAEAEALVSSAIALLRDNRDKISPELRNETGSKITALRIALDGNDPGQIYAAHSALTSAHHMLTERLATTAAH